MSKLFGMKTQEGNQLVERIVDAAVKMRAEQDATWDQACDFAKAALDRLAAGEGFAEAGTATVRLTAYYDINQAVE